MITIVRGTIPEVVDVVPQQLPIAPIPVPLPGAEALGVMTWDLPEVIVYTPYEEVTAQIEFLNPSDEDRLYGVSYYFLNPEKAIVAEDYLYFLGDSLEFSAFILPARGTIPMVSTLSFAAPGTDYTFGLRLLLLEMVDSSARVIQETSRLEVLLASSYGGQDILSPMLMLMVLVIPIAMLLKEVRK